jgi:excisionase family DNA binding protein
MRDKLLTVEETAELLGRTVFAVYRLVERKQIPYRKAGRQTVFLEGELQAWIADLPGLSLEEVRERQAGPYRRSDHRRSRHRDRSTASRSLLGERSSDAC